MKSRFRRRVCGVALAALLPACAAPNAKPVFKAESVLPAGGSVATALAPGMMVSIYGKGLGPATACNGEANTMTKEAPSPARPQQMHVELLIYPKSLCGVEVTLGGKPVGLIYVHSDQINFKVPQETPVDGTALLVVRHRGAASDPVAMKLGLEIVGLKLESPALTQLPVWLKVEMPFGWQQSIRYPFDVYPAGLSCHEVELRLEGRAAQPLPGTAGFVLPRMGGGPECGFLGLPREPARTGRIPLHLLYRLDRAGRYEARFITRRIGPGGVRSVYGQSAWTAFAVAESTPEQRQGARNLTALPKDPVTLLSEALPDLLANRDAAALGAFAGLLHHPDRLVRSYAMYAMSYWPKSEARQAVAAAAKAKGGNEETRRLLGLL